MYPAEFEYFAPQTLDEAIRLLNRYGPEAKVLAGGQSLIPSLNMRLSAPELLVEGATGYAIFMAAWGVVVVGSVDNFLRPILISGRVEVPTLAVFIGVMGVVLAPWAHRLLHVVTYEDRG